MNYTLKSFYIHEATIPVEWANHCTTTRGYNLLRYQGQFLQCLALQCREETITLWLLCTVKKLMNSTMKLTVLNKFKFWRQNPIMIREGSTSIEQAGITFARKKTLREGKGFTVNYLEKVCRQTGNRFYEDRNLEKW